MKNRTSTGLLLMLALILGAGCGGDRENELRASGTIEVDEVRITARTPGIILRMAVDEGDVVAAGDTLAVIDHDLMVLQLAQAEAGAEAAAAQLALLRKGARAEDIAAAQAAVRQAEAQLKQARQDAERFRTLFEAGSTTQKMRDDAEARLQVAQAGYDAAVENLRKLENLARPEEIRAAEARHRQAVATANVLRRQIEDAFITAPISGTVTVRSAEEGENVGPGATLMTLANLEKVYLRIYVPEDALGHVVVGREVDVFTDSHPGEPVRGRVTYVSPRAEFTPKNVQTRDERVKLVYEVNVTLPNPDGRLKPGMYADAVLPINDGAPDA